MVRTHGGQKDSWLSGNNDVGKVNIGVLVNDILGSENRKIITIDVGNKNEKPNVNHQSSQLIGWDEETRDGEIIYLKNILIKEELMIELYDAESNGLFVDSDIKHGDEIEYSMRSNLQKEWGRVIDNFAEIKENKLVIRAESSYLLVRIIYI